jgi:hypothetical protein
MNTDNQPIDRLEEIWKADRQHSATDSVAAILDKVKENQRKSEQSHIATIIILTITVVTLVAFFVFVAPFQNSMSRMGCTLMLASLAIRIGFEIVSLSRSRRMDTSLASRDANLRNIRFHAMRKLIHGPVMMSAIIAYTVGFFMLTPEFAEYFSGLAITLIDGSYILGAYVLGKYLRNVVKREEAILAEMQTLQAALTQEV